MVNSEKDMGDYLYNSWNGTLSMCFCLSDSMIDWWTHRSSLAFSFSALDPVFSGQDVCCFVDFLTLTISASLNWVLTFFFPHPFGSSDFLLLGFFLLLPPQPDCLPLVCAYQLFPFPPICSPIFHRSLSLSLCVVFGLCSPHLLWFSSLMDSLSTHRQPHATPA